jgi:predicted transcriptional regulator
MSGRRPMGSLEADILASLWAASGPMTPAAVREQLSPPLAYTTVSTILARLWQKGLVRREREGKVYLYTAAVGEADLMAQRMHQTLKASGDQRAVLSRFVDTLTVREARALRDVLDKLEEEA